MGYRPYYSLIVFIAVQPGNLSGTDNGEFIMCGLVGIISGHSNGFANAEANCFQDMLFVDMLRGFDSTGVIHIDNDLSITILKEASNALDFMSTDEFKKEKRASIFNGKVLAGHNRAATRGSITDKNAHPFVIDDKIILMQNGTYKGDHKHHKDVEVDTEAVAHVIVENEDITTALKKINAAYALVWYNVENNTLHIIRNSERPLYIGYLKNGGFIWASEKSTIDWACSRNNIELKDDAYLLKEYCLLSIKLDNRGKHIISHNDIKAAYEWPKVSHMPAIPHTPKQQQHPRQAANSEEPRFQNQKSSLAFQIDNLIIQTRPELLVNEVQKSEAIAAGLKIKNSQQNVIIELSDYFAANNHPECDTWFVFGSLISVIPDSPESHIVFYWFVRGIDETEVVNYIMRGMYEVEVTSLRTMQTMLSSMNKYTVISYGAKATLVENVVEGEARVVH